MRAASAEQKAAIVGTDRDPLLFLIDTVFDEKIDKASRMAAAAICLPYLHPRLSATQGQATHTVTRLDGAELLDRIDDRIARLAAPPAPAPAAIETEATVVEDPEEAT